MKEKTRAQSGRDNAEKGFSLRDLKQEKGFYRDVLLLMLPMVFQNFITNFMSLADTFMVGALGETELAAVTMANTPFFIVQLLTFGIQSGACVLVAQYYGKGNKAAINRVLGIALYVSLFFSLVIVAISTLAPATMMRVLTNNDTLIAPGADYARVVCFAYLFGAISGIYIAVQRSMENPRLGAVVLSMSGVLNVFLNWVLIFGRLGMPQMGVMGAALATAISRGFELVVSVVYALFSKRLRLQPGLMLRPGRLISADFVRYALPVVINETLWSLGTSLYTVIMGHMPDNTPIIAAYTIAGNLDRVLSVCLFACSGAAAILIGKGIGEGKPRHTLMGQGVALNLVAVCIGVFSAVMVLLVRGLLAEKVLFPLMGLGAEAVGTAMFMLLIIAIELPFRALNITNVVGVLRGGGDVNFALLVDVAPMYVVCVPLCALCGLVLKLGIGVVYICMYLDDAVKMLLCLLRLRSGKWINNVTREAV